MNGENVTINKKETDSNLIGYLFKMKFYIVDPRHAIKAVFFSKKKQTFCGIIFLLKLIIVPFIYLQKLF